MTASGALRRHTTRVLAALLAIGLLMPLSAACAATAPMMQSTSPSARTANDSERPGEPSFAGAAPPAALAAAPVPAATAAARGPSAPGGANVSPADLPPIDRKIIYNGNMSLVVTDADATLKRIGEIAVSLGGLVVNSTVEDRSGARAGSAVIRVPAEKFDTALDQIRPLASQVTKDTKSTQDVTEEYYDQDARVRALQAQEETYYKLLNQAKSIDEVLKVNQALQGVRVEIERSQARMRVIDRTSAMATITIAVSTAAAAKPVTSGWNLPDTVTDALRASLSGLQRAATLLIGIVMFVWLWGPIVVVVLIVRSRRRRGRAPNPPVAPVAAPPAPQPSGGPAAAS
jgi:hypothetical protein